MPSLLKTIVKQQVVVLLFICVAGILHAQQAASYHFSHLDFNQGLSHNQVTCIYKDARGFMWFGTMSGLNRYDGYAFKTFRRSVKDTSSLSDDYISNITAGPDNRLWIETRLGYVIYDPATENFDRHSEKTLRQMGMPPNGLADIVHTGATYWFVFHDKGIYYTSNSQQAVPVFKSKAPGSISDIKADSKNNLWIVDSSGLILKIDAATKKVISPIAVLQHQQHGALTAYKLFIDLEGDIWIYAGGAFSGVYLLTVKDNKLQQIAKDQGTAILSSNIVLGMAEDNKGLIWIATDHGGLNILNKKNSTVQVLMNKQDDENSIAQNSLTTLYKDDQGIIWVGTYKQGINYYHEGILKFPLYHHQASDVTSLPYNDVNRFAEDAKGNIWIGTNGGGLIYFDRSNNTFKQFKHNPANSNSLTNDVIVSLCIDHNNILWVGTYFGGLDSYDGKTFTHHRHNAADSTSLADDRVWEIYEDNNYNLWIGTLEAGLEQYDRNSNRFHHYKPFAPNSVYSPNISEVITDKAGNLWVGTAYGISVRYKNAAAFKLLVSDNSKLSNNNVLSIFNDSRGAIWVGTRDGLNIFNPANNTFQSFGKEDGLPDNAILNIVEDKAQNLWISTPNGVSRVNYKGSFKDSIRISCVNYDKQDGLQEKEFNENAALATRNGEIIFGGAEGFNLFNPANLKVNSNAPPVVLTGLQVFNESVQAGDKIDDHVIINKAISETDEITLRYDENVFSIEFAALSFINPQKNKYAYKLEGFNKNWLFTNGSTRTVTYTNLDPGHYTFYVKAANEAGVWNEKGIAVNIVVLPPFWKTPLAYLLCLLATIAILLFARRMIIQQARMRFALEHERKEAQRMRELDMMKIRFFTNVSHEFRTPLSLILTPLERMIKSAEAAQKAQYQLIYRNGRRLMNLVNQLLDFRKMEVHELKLHPSEGDIIQFIKDSSWSFTDIADKKRIQFSYTSNLESLYTCFDHDKLERILFNLLSNAFKFTPENGVVSVDVLASKKEEETLLEIKVKDNGIGIPAGRLEKIFERFFQNDTPDDIVNVGSGIGLAITREFVHLLNGEVSVESVENKGSCFTVLLPVKENLSSEAPPCAIIEETSKPPETVIGLEEAVATTQKKHTVLLIDDNEDFLFYLKDNLRECYNIAEAANGKEGWQKVLSVHPDIVVCDVNMPVMNGIELCRKIKNDARTRHTPVILLTAVAGEEQQLPGIEAGAADYMAKPFNFEILLSRIRNLLTQQQSLRQTFARQVEVKASDIKIESTDEKFVQAALAIVEKNISNADFSVEDLSRGLLLSRAAVYKKIFVLTGKTPIEFIRSVRLQRAAQLLEKTKKTVSEVAYETGFNNPKYFSKYFKSEFGVVPSAWQAEKQKLTKHTP